MIKYIILVFVAIFCITNARPNSNNAPLNMVTVPTNCPEGQQLINGQCRDVWRFGSSTPLPSEDPKNELNRAKRQVDYDVEQILQLLDEDDINRNIISVPAQCPDGYKLDALGVCRKIFL